MVVQRCNRSEATREPRVIKARKFVIVFLVRGWPLSRAFIALSFTTRKTALPKKRALLAADEPADLRATAHSGSAFTSMQNSSPAPRRRTRLLPINLHGCSLAPARVSPLAHARVHYRSSTCALKLHDISRPAGGISVYNGCHEVRIVYIAVIDVTHKCPMLLLGDRSKSSCRAHNTPEVATGRRQPASGQS
jgi:hypothetical protein